MTLADFPAKVLLRRLRQQYRLVFQYPRRSSPSAEPPGTAQLVGTRRSRVSRKLLIGSPNSTPFTTHRKLRDGARWAPDGRAGPISAGAGCWMPSAAVPT